MKVYRIENENGNGPYTEDGKSTVIYKKLREDDQWDLYSHPTPVSDKYLVKSLHRLGANQWDHPGLFYGFGSLEACRDWFYKDEWLDDFEKNGFNLVEIKIDSKYVGFGDKQLVFDYSEIQSKIKLPMEVLKQLEGVV